MAAASGTSEIEQALIRALAKRYPSNPAEPDFGPWNEAYAGAMRQVFVAHCDDVNICALYAEAVMNRTPWALWDLVTGKPAQTPEPWKLWKSLRRR